MFPFDLEEEEINPVSAEKEPSDYEIDLRTGKLTGRIITGLDAIKQWVVLTLSTDRYFYNQFSWNYGSELNSLIGQNYEKALIESEARRMVEDALSPNRDILGIEDFECTFENDKLTVKFRLLTNYGGGDIVV